MLEGVERLSVDQLVTLTTSEIRSLDLEDLLSLLAQLGLVTDGIETRSAAITRLMQNAYE